MKTIFSWIINTRIMAVCVALFAIAMAVATFVENDYGTGAARVLIYNARWFELIMLVMVINFIGNIFKYRLATVRKLPVLVFHLSFVVILIGAAISRYVGFEGIMHIREGEEASTMLSGNAYVSVTVSNDDHSEVHEDAVFFSQLVSTNYKLKGTFAGQVPYTVNIVGFVAHAKESLQPDYAGDTYLHLVTTDGRREDVFIRDGDIRSIHNQLFTFNNYVEGAMNFTHANGKTTLQPPIGGSVMQMTTQTQEPVARDSVADVKIRQLYSFGPSRFVVSQIAKGHVVLLPAPKEEHEQYPSDILTLKVKSGNEERVIAVQGSKGSAGQEGNVMINGLQFTVSYGAKVLQVPFALKLRDFQLERYPGTNSASSYASEVTLIDEDATFDYRIFMNHVLDYKGYRFFQSSYDGDELGTILSVNHDYLGTLITYVGYTFMGVAMFLTLFWNGTRFRYLSSLLKKSRSIKAALVLAAIGMSFSASSQHAVESPLSHHVVPQEHAQKFGELLIQDLHGRIKPVHTYAVEALRKVYKKDYYEGYDAVQVMLSAQVDAGYWSHKDMIKVKPAVMGSKLVEKLRVDGSHASMADFFGDGRYILESDVEEAVRKKKILRNATDNEIINLDDRANVWWNLLRGSLMNIYPKTGDPDNKWYTGNEETVFVENDTMVLKMHRLYMTALAGGLQTGDYTQADEYLSLIRQYQEKIGGSIMPPAQKVKIEIWYNKLNLFKRVMFYYMLVGFAFLVLAFVNLFRPDSRIAHLLLKVFSGLTLLGLAVHVTGIGLRWYISGHEPWSNGYEAVVFIAFITVLAGLIFSYKKSKFTLASTVIFSSFLLGIAHGSLMNPEITNLVPVLKSYWLMIHVAVITSSYGFLGLGSLLGFVVLLLYILRTSGNSERLNKTINELARVNELTLTVGLYALAIGTFLGGVWANESWGRYWSWDPKEVWALISVMVYVFVLHMRIVPGLSGRFAFSLASLFSIGTLIMTFFGVNYYLSGMHSYAAGDPVPIPTWVYFAIAFFVVFSAVSYWRYRSFNKSS